MASESRPTERTHDESSKVEIQPHSSVYYANGDIALLSTPGQDGVITAFKVDKVFLSRHSPVFEAMFSFPSPDNVEKYDEVPLVRLQDTAKELEFFLSTIYDPTTLPSQTRDDLCIVKDGLVEGVLKLSTKYQVDNLRERVVKFVSADWPQTLVSWDKHESYIRRVMYEHEGDLVYGSLSMDHLVPEPCKAIRLAREYGIDEILPAAFYHLSRIPIFSDSDDEDLTLVEGLNENIIVKDRSARFSLLSKEDLLCLQRGTKAIAIISWKIAQHARIETTKARDSGGRDHAKCEARLESFIDKLHDGAMGYSIFDSFDPLKAFLCEDFKNDGLCRSCFVEFPSNMRMGRFELWNKLPTVFGLPKVQRQEPPATSPWDE